jgi:hypothetical protein
MLDKRAGGFFRGVDLANPEAAAEKLKLAPA